MRVELALIATLACGCAKDKVSSAKAEAAADAGRSPNVALDAAPLEATSDTGVALDCNAGEPRAGKSIGHTSVVFKLELSNGKKAAFKPHAKAVKDRYRGEVAAYRLATALGVPNVPPVCFRTFDVAALSSALTKEGRDLVDSDVVVEHHEAKGALIPWIDGLTFLPLEKEPLRTDVHRWLTNGTTIPPGKIELARQVSTLFAFDYMTGNWDRMSGENVGLDRTGMVLFIDNDAAFMQAPPADKLERNKALVEASDRFSRSFVARVRGLDEQALTALLGDESPGTPLVAPAVVSLVARRTKELVALVDRKIAAHGEAATLFFP